jgi:hypothetical protein
MANSLEINVMLPALRPVCKESKSLGARRKAEEIGDARQPRRRALSLPPSALV